MAEHGLFSISDFAKYSRTTRDTLLHYDRIGLLKPVHRGENNYRYYSSAQLAVVNVIRMCQQLGMSLDEIRIVKDQRSPELMETIYLQQIEKIDKKIEDWIRARKLLLALQKTLTSVKDVETSDITIKFLPAEAIVMGDLNDYSRGRTYIDAQLSFYQSMREKYPDLDLNYQVWATFSEERIKRRDWIGSDRLYFHNPEGHDRRPAALYAIGYMYGGYKDGGPLFEKVLDYIEENNFEVCGPAFEEHPLNEICVIEESDYLMRVLITVREKGSRSAD